MTEKERVRDGKIERCNDAETASEEWEDRPLEKWRGRETINSETDRYGD